MPSTHLIGHMLRYRDWVVGEYLVVRIDASGLVDIESQITHLGPPDDVARVPPLAPIAAWPRLTDAG